MPLCASYDVEQQLFYALDRTSEELAAFEIELMRRRESATPEERAVWHRCHTCRHAPDPAQVVYAPGWHSRKGAHREGRLINEGSSWI